MHRAFARSVAAAGFILSLAAHAATGFETCSEHFFQGKAPVQLSKHPGAQRELCFNGFAVLHSGESKTPIYVAEHLTYQRIMDARDETRTDRFYEEARLPSAERATLDDYRQLDSKKRHYDRGHQAPAGEMHTPEAMAQSFSLANMVPQAPHNNRVVWKNGVEKAVRKYVLKSNDVYVVTGPVYEGQVDTVGKVWIPAHLFKVVYDPARNKAWAYWVDNTDTATLGGLMSYPELVRRTGIDFFPGAKPL